MSTGLTSHQLGMLRKLVIDDAKRLGYGTTYVEWNERDWPKRLKELKRIAHKLVMMQDNAKHNKRARAAQRAARERS